VLVGEVVVRAVGNGLALVSRQAQMDQPPAMRPYV
jgi:hypothetical protein